MIKHSLILLTTLLGTVLYGFVEKSVKVAELKGTVLVRYGLEENWQKATAGMALRDIDTILSGDDAEVKLSLPDGSVFVLTANSLVDIVDLKMVTEKELFLFMMSNKVKQIEPVNEKTRLKVGNVSVLHAESKIARDSSRNDSVKLDQCNQERNGAMALYLQKLYPNTVIKLYKMMRRYDSLRQDPEVYYYLAKSFETLNLTGQAVDAYEKVLEFQENAGSDSVEAKKWADSARQAIRRFKK